MTIQYFLALVSGIYIIFFSIGASQKNANWIIKFDETHDIHDVHLKQSQKIHLSSPQKKPDYAESVLTDTDVKNSVASGIFADNPAVIDRDADMLADAWDTFPLWGFATNVRADGMPISYPDQVAASPCTCDFVQNLGMTAAEIEFADRNSGGWNAHPEFPLLARDGFAAGCGLNMIDLGVEWTVTMCNHNYTANADVRYIDVNGNLGSDVNPETTYKYQMQKLKTDGTSDSSHAGLKYGPEPCMNAFQAVFQAENQRCDINITMKTTDLQDFQAGLNVDPKCAVLLCCDGFLDDDVFCPSFTAEELRSLGSQNPSTHPDPDVTYETHVTLGLTHACSDVYGSHKASGGFGVGKTHATTQNHCMKTTDLLEHHNEDNSTVFHTWYALHWTVLALASVHIVIVIVLMFIPEKFGFDSERFQMFHAIIPVLVFAVTLTTTVYFFLLHDGDDDLAEPARTDGANFTLPGRHGVYEHFDFELNSEYACFLRRDERI